MADDFRAETAEARAQLVSKLYGLLDNLEQRVEALDHASVEALDHASIEAAAEMVPLMVAPVAAIEAAVRELDELLDPDDPSQAD